jgi:hypothetical protein
LRIKRPDELDCNLAIGQDKKLAVDPVLFQSLADQPYIRAIVLDKENGIELSV